MDYKGKIYSSYRSAFKGDASKRDLIFGAGKVRPILEPWLSGVSRQGAVADLGCGAGELLWALQEMGFTDLHGVDISEEQTATAREFFPQVRTGDIFAFLADETENRFDVITVFDVIEHLTRQQTFDLLELIQSRLKPGGVFIAHVPNGWSPFVGQVFWGDMTHEWCLTPDSASTLCRLHGFTAYEAAEHLGTSTGIKGSLRKVAWKMVRLAFRGADLVETGCSRDIWTRCFVFKARKAPPAQQG